MADLRGEAGDDRPASEAEQLLATMYSELRAVARRRLAGLPPGQTLSATDLVHEVWCRLGRAPGRVWENQAEFFAAAGTLMRNILVDRIRTRSTLKRGGKLKRVALDPEGLGTSASHDLVAVNDALENLGRHDPRAANLVTLRFFGGMTLEEAAEALAVSERTARRDWTYARAWLFRELDLVFRD